MSGFRGLPAFSVMACLMLLAGCGEAREQPAQQPGKVASGDVPDVQTPEPAPTPVTAETPESKPAGWAGLHDRAVQARMKKRVKQFYETYNEPFGLVFTDRFKGDDSRLAAGQLAFDTGTAAVVIAIDQKDVQFVGDESFTDSFSNSAGQAVAANFAAGDYDGGIETAIGEISQLWSME